MKKSFAIFIIIVAVAYGAWRVGRGPADDGRGQELFYGRAWLDHLPATKTETFRVFGTSKKHALGWFAERSIWKGEWERFRYEARGDGQLEILLPHSGKKLRMSYRAWKCNEKDFEYCLELGGSGGSKKYYSRRGWEKDSLDDTAFEDQLAAGLADR
jgi:hypothetical protein